MRQALWHHRRSIISSADQALASLPNANPHQLFALLLLQSAKFLSVTALRCPDFGGLNRKVALPFSGRVSSKLSTTRTTPALRSTFFHLNASISPRLIPVVSARSVGQYIRVCRTPFNNSEDCSGVR